MSTARCKLRYALMPPRQGTTLFLELSSHFVTYSLAYPRSEAPPDIYSLNISATCNVLKAVLFSNQVFLLVGMTRWKCSVLHFYAPAFRCMAWHSRLAEPLATGSSPERIASLGSHDHPSPFWLEELCAELRCYRRTPSARNHTQQCTSVLSSARAGLWPPASPLELSPSRSIATGPAAIQTLLARCAPTNRTQIIFLSLMWASYMLAAGVLLTHQR